MPPGRRRAADASRSPAYQPRDRAFGRLGGYWPPRIPARVLVATDLPDLLKAATHPLTGGPYVVRGASSLADMLAAIDRWRPHLVIVDMALFAPDVDADPQTPHLARFGLPVIAVTRRSDLVARLAAFEQGADDVVVASVSADELRARIAALVRRTYGGPAAFAPILRAGPLEVDIANRSTWLAGEMIHLSPLEVSLLYLLVSHAGDVVTREQILDTIWGAEYSPSSNVVDRLVSNLRRRLGDNPRRPSFIASVPGIGYRLLTPRRSSRVVRSAGIPSAAALARSAMPTSSTDSTANASATAKAAKRIAKNDARKAPTRRAIDQRASTSWSPQPSRVPPNASPASTIDPAITVTRPGISASPNTPAA
ncbi:MAG TPA: response regulator transcription factor [Chloroflexota bacterium]|nr:response regulator transcription factor [Chloroflexota bacterium]